jgi:hypothetical protein
MNSKIVNVSWTSKHKKMPVKPKVKVVKFHKNPSENQESKQLETSNILKNKSCRTLRLIQNTGQVRRGKSKNLQEDVNCGI